MSKLGVHLIRVKPGHKCKHTTQSPPCHMDNFLERGDGHSHSHCSNEHGQFAAHKSSFFPADKCHFVHLMAPSVCNPQPDKALLIRNETYLLHDMMEGASLSFTTKVCCTDDNITRYKGYKLY